MNRVNPIAEATLNTDTLRLSEISKSVMKNKSTCSTSLPDILGSSTVCSNVLGQPITISSKNSIFKVSDDKECSSKQITALVKFITCSIRSNSKKKGRGVQIRQSKEKRASQVSVSRNNNSFTSYSDIFCRFCQEFEPENELMTPCLCSGTLKYIHQSCLQRWIKIQDNRFCELCKYEFKLKVTTKPFKEWKKLNMNMMERRKIICSVTFHIIALTCVVWSLYVLIERTTEEMQNGILEWPFWTKLIVVAIGFIGGIVFMYVQCRMYVGLCRKWHDFNRTFVVQNITHTELVAAQRNTKITSGQGRRMPILVHGDTSTANKLDATEGDSTAPFPSVSVSQQTPSRALSICDGQRSLCNV